MQTVKSSQRFKEGKLLQRIQAMQTLGMGLKVAIIVSRVIVRGLAPATPHPRRGWY
jgi:hypothetical protein